MRNLARSSAGLVLLLLAGACTDRQPTMPDDGPLLSHQVFTITNGAVCRVTTFENGEGFHGIHPELNYLIEGSNAHFPGWSTLTSGHYANNPSPPTIALMTAASHEIIFDQPVYAVGFDYASAPDVTLNAFDASGTLVATVIGPSNVQPDGLTVWDYLAVAVSADVITRVTVTGGAFWTAIDNFGNCTWLATPEERIDRLIGDVQELVESGVLDSGNGNALLATLDNALKAIARRVHRRGNPHAGGGSSPHRRRTIRD
jgi:hypothetical protein